MKNSEDRLQIFMNHRDNLMDYVTTIVGCRASAEDVVQEAYFSIVPAGLKSSPAINVSFLYRVVRNKAIDFLRRRATEQRYTAEQNVLWLESSSPDDPESSLLITKQLQCIAEQLGEMPEDQRAAVEMYRLGGCTLAEVAERLEVSVSTAHRLIRDAMLKIAKGVNATG